MNRNKYVLLTSLIAFAATATVQAQPVLMSAPWATQICEGWNNEPVLVDELSASGWAANNRDRGYKIMHLYRSECESSPRVELRIVDGEDGARCEYGGAVENESLESDADYLMHATTERWQEMGSGEYGPMKAMMFGRLKFSGPKWEAMKNMGPFKKFLLLTGSVTSDASTCPE